MWLSVYMVTRMGGSLFASVLAGVCVISAPVLLLVFGASDFARQGFAKIPPGVLARFAQGHGDPEGPGLPGRLEDQLAVFSRQLD